MNKAWQHIVIGISTFCLSYVLLTLVLSNVYLGGRRLICWTSPYIALHGGQEKSMLRDWPIDSMADIIVIGSSHAYRGYIPHVFEQAGYSLFTAGSSSQNPFISRLLLESEIHPQSQALVIVDLFDVIFTNDGMESSLRWIENFPDKEQALSLACRHNDIRTWNAFAVRMCERRALTESFPRDYIHHGYSISSHILKEPIVPDTTAFVGNAQALEDLHQLLTYLESKKLRYLLCTSPAYPSHHLAQRHADFLRYLEPVLSKHNCRYLDFTENAEFGDFRLFSDANHLNFIGAEKFNRMLIQTLDNDAQTHGVAHLNREK